MKAIARSILPVAEVEKTFVNHSKSALGAVTKIRKSAIIVYLLIRAVVVRCKSRIGDGRKVAVVIPLAPIFSRY
jgi:hypothetical protein